MKLCKIPCENLVMSVSYSMILTATIHHMGPLRVSRASLFMVGWNPFPPLVYVTELENSVIKDNYRYKNPNLTKIEFSVDFLFPVNVQNEHVIFKQICIHKIRCVVYFRFKMSIIALFRLGVQALCCLVWDCHWLLRNFSKRKGVSWLRGSCPVMGCSFSRV